MSRLAGSFGIVVVLASAIGAAQVLTPPGPPGTLTFLLSDDIVTLDWSAPASGGAVSTYIVEAGSLPSSANIVVFPTGNSATRLVARAAPGVYFVRIRSQNAAGTSASSNEVQVRIEGGACTGPASPGTMTGSAIGTIVTLNWGAAPAATSYVIEAGSTVGASNIAVFDTQNTNTTFSAIAPPGTYFVRVRARNTCGTSAPSSEVVITVASSVLLRDDFNGSALDGAKWYVPTGSGTFFGRTQIRPPSQPLTVANGVIRLQLDTFNPTALTPGDSFWGSEIVTRQVFTRGNGLVFRARVRVVGPIPGGMVASLFSYVTRSNARDEIDFELLTNDLARSRILTNIFQDDSFNVAGRPFFAIVPGLNLGDFNDYEVRWLPDRVQWKVNGLLVREEVTNIPDEPMTVRLNFWAPDASFADAFNALLQPTANPAENRTYFYELDFVEVFAL